MKFLSLLFAIYFFGLSIRACKDEITVSDNCKTAYCMHIESTHADHHASDECSPLCNCNCCGSIIVMHELSHTFKAGFTQLQKTLYAEHSISEISNTIWQPPRI